jgi:hypothetical protein
MLSDPATPKSQISALKSRSSIESIQESVAERTPRRRANLPKTNSELRMNILKKSPFENPEVCN